MNFSNVQLWNALRAKYKSFESITAEATAETFTDKGWSDIQRNNLNALNQFFQLSMRVAFNKMDIAKVNTRLEESGLVEVYGGQNGGYLQRISIESISPISPKYLNLADGSSVDPFVVRKPNARERFFECGNFNYQSLITLQEYQVKTIFLDEFGMSSFIAGIMAGLENGYKQQKELNIYKAIHMGINDTNTQETQTIRVNSWTDGAVTDDELLDFVAQLQDLATVMQTSITQSGFNTNGFETAVSPEDHVVLVRSGIMNQIKRKLILGAYNPDTLAIPFNIMEVNDFGGLVPINPDSPTVALQPVYDKLGTEVGFINANFEILAPAYKSGDHYVVRVEIQGSESVEHVLEKGEYAYRDDDADVLAAVLQKGFIFEEIKEPYQVRPIQNPAGLYENYWASAPNNMIRFDKNYDCVTIRKPTT